MSFRSSSYCERYKYVSIDLQNPIVAPAVNLGQRKTGYKFMVDNGGERHPFDWYNAYFEIDFNITKMDNTGYAVDDEVAIINGGFSMIRSINCDFNGVRVLSTEGVNHAVNVKNLTEYSKSYCDSLGPSMFHYVDTSTLANSQEFLLDAANHNHVLRRNGNYNLGFAKRKALLSASTTNSISLPLNRFGFFDSFENEIVPNGKISIEIDLESDANIIFRAAGAATGRFVITKWVLWVPKMIFNPAGEKVYVDRYLKSHTWNYLKKM